MRDRILQLVQVKGPLLPVDIRSELKIDSMFVGAYLSELIKSGKIKQTHAKIGSSPLYYVDGQQRYLEQLREHLHPKLQQVYDSLKNNKILYDNELTEVMKAAIRDLKDFAIPLTVNKTELFWKFHLIPPEEATNLIKQKLAPKEEKKEIPQPIPQKVEVAIPVKTPVENITEHKPKVHDKEIKKAVATVERRAQEIKAREEKIIIQRIEPREEVEDYQERIEPERKIKHKREKKEERKEEVSEEKEEPRDELQEEIDWEKQKDRRKINVRERSLEDIQDPLLDKVKEYFKDKHIIIKEAFVVRKERELELIVTIPSVIGRISYFCAVRNKGKCNEGDVSAAVIKAQSKNLPTLFLTTGDVTKKALEMVGKEFKQLVVKRMD